MTDQHGPKQFDATPARKQKAKRDGNVARSSEVSGLVAFASAAAGAAAIVPLAGGAAASALRALAASPQPDRYPPVLGMVLALGLVPAALAGAGALAAGVVQSGGLHVNGPTFQLARLHPGSGLKQMFGAETAVGVVRAAAAFAAVTLVLWPLLVGLFARSTTLGDVTALAALALDGMQRACCATVIAGALFAAADYALVRRRWLRQLKMTFEDLRRDQKENDGDPAARSRRKALHRTLVRGSIGRTREASFVVVNPTHIAVAIRYRPPTTPVPEIVVRAADDGARRVRALAREHGVPIVEHVPLARALFAHGDAGRAIPSDTFVAVARVIAELIRAGVLT